LSVNVYSHASKVAVIGTGFVESSLVYSLMIHETVSEILLIDVDKKRAEGEAMDLNMVCPSFDLSEFGLELARIVESIIRDENAILTVSSLLHDFYRVDGICLSVSTIVNRNGVRETLKLPLTDEEIMKLQSSASTLKSMVKSLIL
jgi:malate/lactate dehydrogenase